MALSVPESVTTTGQQGGPPTIPLGRLIDFALQKTYHELTVLAELLPRKSDMERKIEITTFTNSTRQLYVRLLALVKWAASSDKVEKCANIVNFLDKQSMLFIETADMFAMLSRDTLVQARLPSFHIPCAAEILTTGRYSRLPSCIREKIVPPDPISAEEKRSTFERLNRIIQYRLLSSEVPSQMSSSEIKRGRVLFRVDNEFEVSLTLMGDEPQTPWRLLNIDILVADKDSKDCESLVHPLQISYIHQLVQSRVVEHPKPLRELYQCLHFFCLSLQLDVLHTQIIRLCRERFGDCVRIEQYIPGSRLKLHFWRDHYFLYDQQPFLLMIHVDEENLDKPLQVTQLPEVVGDEEHAWTDHTIQGEFLSVEKLLIQTIHFRSRQKLSMLRDDYLKNLLPVDVECVLEGSPPLLRIPIVHPCSPSEHLVLLVDSYTGYVAASVPQYEPPMMFELHEIFNGLARDASHGLKSRLATTLSNLKLWIMLKRCRKTLQHLPVLAMDTNPVTTIPEDHPLNKLGKSTLFVKLCKLSHYFVVVELKAEKLADTVDFNYYLLRVEDDNRPSTFKKLDNKLMTQGLCFDADFFTTAQNEMKDTPTPEPSSDLEDPASSQKPPEYFFSDLAHIVAYCDDNVPFTLLIHELGRRRIPSRGLQIETSLTNFCVNVLEMPLCTDIPEDIAEELQRSLLACTFRFQAMETKFWHCEMIFHDCPLTTRQIGERGDTRPVHFHYDFAQDNMVALIDEWLADWSIVNKIYGVVIKYISDHTRMKYASLVEASEILSYSYKNLTISYGPEKKYTVTINWRPRKTSSPDLGSAPPRYELVFGTIGLPVTASNPHSIIAHHLSSDFGKHESVMVLLQTLKDTFQPLLSLSRLSSVPQLGVVNSRPQVPVQTFMIIPQSSTSFRVVYRDHHCLEVQCLNDEDRVVVRDAAFSHFDKNRHVEGYKQIPGLRAFLTKFSDQKPRKSESQKNLPPPLLMESVDAFFSPSQVKVNSPASTQSDGGENSPALRFAPVHPKTSPSNPVTPASPRSSIVPSIHVASPNPSAALTPSNIAVSSPLAPPPSSPYPANSPHLTSPSPSSAQQAPSSQNSANADDLTSPAFLLPTASPANPSPSSPAPFRPSPQQNKQLLGGRSPAPEPAASGDLATSMSRTAPPTPGNWAAAIPVMLTHENLDFLCAPSPPWYSALERFIGCAFILNSIQRNRTTGKFALLKISDNGVVVFRLDQLLYRVSLHPQTMQSLHVMISHVDASPATPQLPPDDIQVIERYFDAKVVSIPYKPNAFVSFARLMSTPQRILRDFIQLMRLELGPSPSPIYRWSFQLCLTIPPAAPPIASPGMTSVVVTNNRILFFFQLTPIGGEVSEQNPAPANSERVSIVLPMVYDLQTNVISPAPDRRADGNAQTLNLISSILRRPNEYQTAGECSIFPSIKKLVTTLTMN